MVSVYGLAVELKQVKERRGIKQVHRKKSTVYSIFVFACDDIQMMFLIKLKIMKLMIYYNRFDHFV
jgi:hypothetical protein